MTDTPKHMMTTRERLAVALTGINAPADMIERARNGYYDDFLSELPIPIRTLVHDLQQLGTTEAQLLAERAMRGEFDGTLAEADAYFQTPEGQELMQRLGMKEGAVSQPPPVIKHKGGDR